MGCVDLGGCEVLLGARGRGAPVVYVIDLPEHPFDVATAAQGVRATVARVPVRDWGDSLTPWPAVGLHPGVPGFGGRAEGTLAELADEVMPAVEAAHGLVPARRAICGYSLGGLFSLYAFAREGSPFCACACLSGSVWYEGWVDYLRRACPDASGRFAYLSIGRKERRSGAPIMRGVQEDLEACAEVLRSSGCSVELVVGPGGHLQYHTERLAAGLSALDARLVPPGAPWCSWDARGDLPLGCA